MFVPGMYSRRRLTESFDGGLKRRFPQMEIVSLHYIYSPHHRKKVLELLGCANDILSDAKPTVVLGHSLGGFLAKRIAQTNASVCQLITMGTAHGSIIWRKYEKAHQFGIPDFVDTRTVTFGGYFDPIAHFWQTKTQNSEHHNFFCSHMGFLLTPQIRNSIFEFVQE